MFLADRGFQELERERESVLELFCITLYIEIDPSNQWYHGCIIGHMTRKGGADVEPWDNESNGRGHNRRSAFGVDGHGRLWSQRSWAIEPFYFGNGSTAARGTFHHNRWLFGETSSGNHVILFWFRTVLRTFLLVFSLPRGIKRIPSMITFRR